MKIWSVAKIWSVPRLRGVAATVLVAAVLGGAIANWLTPAGAS